MINKNSRLEENNNAKDAFAISFLSIFETKPLQMFWA